MSAETLGVDLLREVKEEGLGEVCWNTQSFLQNANVHPSSHPALTRTVASTLIKRTRELVQPTNKFSASR